MYDHSSDNQPESLRYRSKKPSRRDLMSRSLQIINSFLKASSEVSEPHDNSQPSSQRGMTRRQFGQSVAVAGAALAALPEVVFTTTSEATLPMTAVEPLAVINFDTVQYLSAVLTNHSDRMTKVIFAEKLMPNSKLAFSSGESEHLMNDCFARAARQGEEFVRQVLVNIEDHYKYPGTDYVLDRDLRHFCEKRTYRLWHQCDSSQTDNLTPLTEEQFKKLFRETRKETLQFIRNGFVKAVQKHEYRALEQENFDPLCFALDAGNINIKWQPERQLLSFTRPELSNLFSDYSLTWLNNRNPLETGPSLSTSELLKWRASFMTQFAKLVHEVFPKTINRTLRSSSSGMVIKHPPQALLNIIGIQQNEAYPGGRDERRIGLLKSSNIYHI